MSCSGPALPGYFPRVQCRHSEGVLVRAKHRMVKGRAKRGADVMLSWLYKPQMVEHHQRKGREDLDITASPCSHVFQCLNHLANEREREGERVTHTTSLQRKCSRDSSSSVEKPMKPQGSFLVLGNLLQISSLMLTHTQTPI